MEKKKRKSLLELIEPEICYTFKILFYLIVLKNVLSTYSVPKVLEKNN